jgi:mannose-6-phosphate isomerase-like protein (cupin superfamily)
MLDDLIRQLMGNPIFGQPDSFFCESPYRRPVRPQDMRFGIFTKPLGFKDLNKSGHLQAQRLLQNIYEQDLVFLPKTGVLRLSEMRDFYNSDLRVLGQVARPVLECYAFNWLNSGVGATGSWTLESFRIWSESIVQGINTSESELTRFISKTNKPKEAIKFFFIQCAGDFLAEASAMARNVLGNFDCHQSELFKILIDEYGYGVHRKKHSTIFEKMMQEAGLNSNVHYYWQFYTAKSMALTNYFHFISADHSKFFRYLGALYYTEASLAFSTQTQAKAVRMAFGDEVSTLYFDEHAHIDVHHGRMAFEKLIKPIVREYGEDILVDIVRGFEEFRLLQDVADQELFSHLAWHEKLAPLSISQMPISQENLVDHEFVESKGELSVTHTHGVRELFSVQSGEINVVVSPFLDFSLRAGESIVIPPGILHGTLVTSAECRYRVTALD